MTVTTTAFLTLVGRNLPALSFLSARHIVSPLKVKLKNTPPNRVKKCSFVKGWGVKFLLLVLKKEMPHQVGHDNARLRLFVRNVVIP